MYVTIIFYESALELIPESMRRHPLISKEWNRNVKKKNRGILLDGAIHQSLYNSLQNSEKRGRPDIIHHSLMNLCYSPLFEEKKVKIIIHTINDECIEIPSNWRVPVNYNRFCGLFSQLLLKRKVPLIDKPILTIFHCTLMKLLENFSNTDIYLFELASKDEKKNNFITKLDEITNLNSVIFLIGGFQHGEANFYVNLPESCMNSFNLVTLYEEVKPAWTIAAKLIHWLEGHKDK